ncbi:MAG: phosphatidate cytidylyltransferase [Desulfuromonadaceae bacterium]|nr:phosphatidate cytidylyltransferase [Desulfuromonadaceae bacterium]
MLPLLAIIILKGGALLFACLLGLFSCFGIFEFYRMALPGRTLEVWLAALSGSALIFTPFAAGDLTALTGVGLLFLFFAILFLFRIREIADAAREVAYALLAFIYIPFLLMHLVMLRQTEFGVQWLIVIMLIVMTNDSAAYYIGSRFGKNRLYPLVSPKKSIEGALGGVLGSICGTLLAKFTFFQQLTFTDALVTAVVIGMLGQLGDLFESMLKRSFGVKDSGTIFPGHGGVLDRLDSILFAAPATYYYVVYIFKG